MRMLVRGASRDEAIEAADIVLEGPFEDGTLSEGDAGYVRAKVDPDRGSEVLSAEESPARFVARLRELTRTRANLAKGHILDAYEVALNAGGLRLCELKPEEVGGPSIAGYHLWVAGAILARYWTSQGILYDAERYETGVDEDRIREIGSSPDGWWLVEVSVG